MTRTIRLPAVFLLLLVFATPSLAQNLISYQDTNFIYRLSVDRILSGDSVNYDCAVRTITIIRKNDNKIIIDRSYVLQTPSFSREPNVLKSQLLVKRMTKLKRSKICLVFKKFAERLRIVEAQFVGNFTNRHIS